MDNKQLLHERIDKNLSEYHEHLISSFDPQTIINMAGRISMMEDTHISMKQQDFSAAELGYLLQFENPLEMLADYHQDTRNDLSDLDFEISIHKMMERPDTASQYPLVAGAVQESDQPSPAEVAAGMVKAETERIVAEFRSKTEPDSPNKTHYMVKVSREFAIHGDTDALFDAVDNELNDDTLSFGSIKSEKGIFAMVMHDPARENQFGPPKESVVKQLKEGIKEVRERPAPAPTQETERKGPSQEGR